MAAISVELALQLASTYQSTGQIEAAAAMYRQIVRAQPQSDVAWHQLGILAIGRGRYQEAVELISKAVAHSPGPAASYAALGVAQRHLQRLDEAIASYQRALALDPNLAEAHNNLGEALAFSGRISEAIASCQRALTLRPDYADAHNHLGLALAQAGQHEAALACFERALALEPNSAAAHNNLGRAWQKIGRWTESMASFDRAIALQPAFAEAHTNRGVSLSAKAEFEPALTAFGTAIACRADHADAWWAMAVVNLLLGRFEEGWRQYDWRLRCRGFVSPRRELAAPRWTGEPARNQTILVHAEQGLGDTLQFLRYVPLVRKRSGAARILLECQPELLRLLRTNKRVGVEVAAITKAESAVPPPPVDWQIPLLSVPWAVKQIEPLEMSRPYLRADPKLRTAWRKRLGTSRILRAGLAWAGSKSHEGDRHRSIEPERLLPLLRIAGVRLYSLQVDARGAWPVGFAKAGLLDFTGDIADFADTAALLSNLDLLITVDTAAAHLAGALGRPVWTLLPFVPDWRWGLDREDTPWYPTMRLFRQKVAGNWDEVIQRVADELTAFIAKSAGRKSSRSP